MVQWAVDYLPHNAIAYDHHSHVLFMKVHWLTMSNLLCSELRVTYSLSYNENLKQ